MGFPVTAKKSTTDPTKIRLTNLAANVVASSTFLNGSVTRGAGLRVLLDPKRRGTKEAIPSGDILACSWDVWNCPTFEAKRLRAAIATNARVTLLTLSSHDHAAFSPWTLGIIWITFHEG
jgi:hypothetical protein